LTYLARLWTTFKKKRDSGPAPMELYTEGDLVTRTVRDVFTSEVDKLVVDNKDVARRIKEVIKLSNPRTRNRVELYEEPIPLFHKYGIEREIEMMYSRHVPLPSGGSLVIDSTEAIVAIDVNSGKFRDHSDAETTAFKTDVEAADEICRQLKLRDLGGVIICDFIDLRYERHRRELEHRLHENLKDDRAKTKVLRMSQFGIIEMTRQRMRPSLKRSVYFDCPHCKGAGLVKTPESMSLDVMRRLRIAIHDQRVQRVELAVCPDVAFYLQNKKRHALSELEENYQKKIQIRAEAALGLDEMRIDLVDNREGRIYLDELGMVAQPPHTTQLGTKPQQFASRNRGGRDDRGRGRPQPQQPPRQREEELADDRFERVEEEIEYREDGTHERAPAGEPAAETEAAPETAEAAIEDAQGEAVNGESGGGRRRRRRRRGRRGRGRNRPFAPGQEPVPAGVQGEGDDQPPTSDSRESFGEEDVVVSDSEVEVVSDTTHADDATSESLEEDPESAATTPRDATLETSKETGDAPKRRRRRRGGRGRRRPAADNGQTEAVPPPGGQAQQPAPPPVVIRTGSTDRHLIEDEPVLPPPVRRPHSARDLDNIPDDFD
ncbi:MAG TPA: ribonuclease E/G, partial [Gemmataceae bacterium]|nr:ribonuclease E/G [Gemmataceae bacterium]